MQRGTKYQYERGENMKPTFVIIGAQKSATTFVHKCLMEHYDIYMLREEIPYFESPDYEQQSIKLEDLFKGRSENALGIKRPSYIGKSEVPPRITRDLPESRIIAVLRNPVERAVSAYFHYLAYGFLPICSLNDGMEQLLQGAYETAYKRSPEILEFGYYYKHLSEYRYFFERKRILVIFIEDIKQDPMGSIQTIYRFLRVDGSYIPRAINSKPMSSTYNLEMLRLLQLRNKLLFRYDLDNTRMYAKGNKINKLLAQSVVLAERSLVHIVGNKKPVLNADLRKQLVEIYRCDIEQLSEIIKRDLSSWLV